MPHPDAVEEILGRLMPPALSRACEEEIGAMLGELAGESAGPAPHPVRSTFRWWLGGVAAAGAAAAIALTAHFAADAHEQLAGRPPVAAMVLVSESGRVQSMLDEGLQDIGDGSAMQATRVNVVEESKLLDEETGIVVQISEPREEVLLMPVSAF